MADDDSSAFIEMQRRSVAGKIGACREKTTNAVTL